MVNNRTLIAAAELSKSGLELGIPAVNTAQSALAAGQGVPDKWWQISLKYVPSEDN